MQDSYRQNRSIGVHLREQHGSADSLIDLSIGGGDTDEVRLLTPAEALELAGLLLRLADQADTVA